MSLGPLGIIINTVLLVIALLLGLIILNSGAKYQFHYGNVPVQDRMKWRILRSILALIVIGLSAVVINLVLPYFE